MIEIPLRGGCAAMIDDEDDVLVKRYKWRALRQAHTTYAIARLPTRDGIQRTLYLHRLVMQAQPGDQVRHVDKNGLNAMKQNLRVIRPALQGAPPAPPLSN